MGQSALLQSAKTRTGGQDANHGRLVGSDRRPPHVAEEIQGFLEPPVLGVPADYAAPRGGASLRHFIEQIAGRDKVSAPRVCLDHDRLRDHVGVVDLAEESGGGAGVGESVKVQQGALHERVGREAGAHNLGVSLDSY